MQKGDYLQTAGARSRKRRRGGQVLLRTCHISGGVGEEGGGWRAGGAEGGKTGIQ